jgi:hypothetical protein
VAKEKPMTPEGKVKRWVDALLGSFGQRLPMWVFKPVQYGMGTRALDYIVNVNGRFLAIETKDEDKWLTPYQRITARMIYETGGTVFIISTIEGVAALGRWLKKELNNGNDAHHGGSRRSGAALPQVQGTPELLDANRLGGAAYLPAAGEGQDDH